MSIATQSLMAQEAALEMTSNNIANANTPGYTRETIVLTEADVVQQGSVTLGGGVTLQGLESVRDQLLNLRIQQQTSQQSSADAQTGALQQLQTLFPTTGSSLATGLSSFFTSLSALSSNPTSLASRQAVLSAGQNLAGEFNTVSSGLSTQQSALDQQTVSDVSSINQLSSQIAGLNAQQAQLTGTGENVGSVEDQIGSLELKLSQLTNLSVTHTPAGDTLTTGTGTPLVVGGKSYALETTAGANGRQQVLDGSGTDITSAISGGDLGGTLAVRDTAIPNLLGQLDSFASQFAAAINAAQAKGYDQNGQAGGPLFTVSATVAGAAASIALATTDPAAIAASSDGSSGSNGNLANLAAVATAKLGSGQSPEDVSAGLIYQVGSDTATAQAESSAIGLSLTQLTQQQSSVSGVSIDEESANLIRYQQAYEAAAKIVNTVATLFNVTLNMGTAVGGS
ncbi:MAG TPA: flagellar hook-associated protein FlgK [Acidobacteriaceae bacterium]